MLEHYIAVGQQTLRCGSTTGTCAAAAACAAAQGLLSGEFPAQVTIETPAGIAVTVEPEDWECGDGFAACSVRKDGGDDIDATHGAKIRAVVTAIPAGIEIDGGAGVGRVTRPGLDQPVGAAAINSVPRQMIKAALQRALSGHSGGLRAVIEVPGGAELAQKTFNPRLGIEGGISILGSTGIVRPMSRAALVATTRAELSVRRAAGVTDLLLTPGNYGDAYVRDVLGLRLQEAVQCSNYIGQALDDAVRLGFASVLLVGHLGKLTKLAAGVTDTHSRTADGRREVFVTHAALCGAPVSLLRQLYKAPTTDAAVALLKEAGLAEPVLSAIAQAVEETLHHRAPDLATGAILFSQAQGVEVMTAGAGVLLEKHQKASLA